MKKLTRLFLALALVVVSATAGCANLANDTYVFRALMTPENEVPPIAGLNASGTAIVFVHVVRDNRGNVTSGTVDFRVDFRGFPADVEFTGLHIHPGPAGVNGPVTISSGVSGGITGASGTISRQTFVASSATAAFNSLTGLLSAPDQYYINLHTRTNPGGAIRAQLQPADVVVVRGAMSTANEVPAITAYTASGSASITAYASRDANGAVTSGSVLFDVRYSFPGEFNFTGLQIHPGPAGINGPVVINPGVAAFTSATGSGSISQWAEVTPANTAGLAALDSLFRNPDQNYVNLHTSVNTGGAIRAQLQRTDTIVLRTHLSPDNQVPPIAGLAANAAGKLTLHVTRDGAGDITSGTAVFDAGFEFPAVTEFTGLHIHPGAAGVNGPVAISSGLSVVTAPDASGNFFLSWDVAASDTAGVNAMRGLLANPAGYYMNLHTRANPGGAIRGQMSLPGEPEVNLTLDPGYYVVEATLDSGQPAGVWGMVALANALSGGFNLGGGYSNGVPGFGAFVLREPATVTLNVAAQALPGQPGPQFSMRLLSGGEEVRGTTSATATRSLAAGFHVVEIRSLSGAGTFQLSIRADVLREGGIAGGYAQPGITGFGAFNLGFRQAVQIRLFGKNFYGVLGSGNLTLTLKDHATGAVRARAQ